MAFVCDSQLLLLSDDAFAQLRVKLETISVDVAGERFSMSEYKSYVNLI